MPTPAQLFHQEMKNYLRESAAADRGEARAREEEARTADRGLVEAGRSWARLLGLPQELAPGCEIMVYSSRLDERERAAGIVCRALVRLADKGVKRAVKAAAGRAA